MIIACAVESTNGWDALIAITVIGILMTSLVVSLWMMSRAS